LPKWKNYENLLEQNLFLVFERPGFALTTSHKNFIILKDTPFLSISASFIRRLVKERKSIKYLVPDNVLEEIEKGGYYKN
jgi:nicotinate-nucleotide adenylyltransferase